MKILIDARLLTRGNMSGIEDYARAIIHEFLSRHPENEYIFFWNGVKKIPFPKEWRKENVKVINWSFPNRLLDIVMRVFHVPHIDMVYDTDIVWSPHFFLLPKPKKAKHVVTFHDLSFVHFPKLYSLRKRFWHWQQDYKRQAMRADHVIAVSKFTEHDLVDVLGVQKQNVSAIYSGINPIFHPVREDDPGRLMFLRANNLMGPFILFVGTLEPRKNIGGIITAFTDIKKNPEYANVKLVIAGKRGWLYDKIFMRAKESPARSDIVFWGEASYEELLYLYNAARVFVWPSFFEGFGHPPLEAQACGTPVVSSNRSSLPEVLGNSALLVDPWNTEELVVALREVLSDETLREELITRGFENCRRFSWERAADELIKVFINLH